MGETAATADPPVPVAHYPLGPAMALTITPRGEEPVASWRCVLRYRNEDGTWRDVTDSDGAAEAFVDVLRHTVTIPVEGFRVVRLVPPPEATGERHVESEEINRSVVVGERVVVTWMASLQDTDHPAPLTAAHLAAVRFLGVPVTHGMLTWRTPGGRELPCAVVTAYTPRSRQGWQWCADLVEQRLGARASRGVHDAAGLGTSTGSIPVIDSWIADFPVRIGRLAAKLHLALATPSSVLPEPVGTVGPSAVHAWHAAAVGRLAQIERIARSGRLDDAAHVLLPRLSGLRAAVDELPALAAGAEPGAGSPGGGIVVQRVHGDLHAGQFLRWPGGMAVIDFDGNPIVRTHEAPGEGGDPLMQPAARDLAQLLLSMDYVGRIADKRNGFTMTEAVDEWSGQARRQLLDAYRQEVAVAGRPDLLDERLLAAFQAEQVCRELLYAAEHRPEWAYAPLAGLRLMVREAHEPRPAGRHRA